MYMVEVNTTNIVVVTIVKIEKHIIVYCLFSVIAYLIKLLTHFVLQVADYSFSTVSHFTYAVKV